MGFYERDYYRGQRSGFTLRAPRTIVVLLIVLNVAIWLVDGVVAGGWLRDVMALHVNTFGPLWGGAAAIDPTTLATNPAAVPVQNTLTQPWLWWQFVTYAFAHSAGPMHVLMNMFVLFVLGVDIEAAYGRREFWRLYLAIAVFAGVVWCAINQFTGHGNIAALGASGAIAGVVVLYALNFPRRTLLFMFVFPMPAWVVGAIVVGMDLLGALQQSGDIAYSIHLAGAAFAFVYYRQRWNLTRLTDGLFGGLRAWRRPKLRVHQPEEELPDDLNIEVDRILEKIHNQGEASLTAKERRILETASREYQRRGVMGGGSKR